MDVTEQLDFNPSHGSECAACWRRPAIAKLFEEYGFVFVHRSFLDDRAEMVDCAESGGICGKIPPTHFPIWLIFAISCVVRFGNPSLQKNNERRGLGSVERTARVGMKSMVV